MKKLLSLLTLLIVAIGTSWAQSDPTLSVTSSADMFKNYTEQKITLSSTFTPSNETSYGGYTVKVENSGNNNGQNYIEILSAGDDIEKITFSVTAGSNGQTITPAILGWTSTEDVTETGKADYVNTTQSAGGSGKKKDISYVEDITYDVSSEGLKRVRFYRQVKNIVVGTAAKANYGNGQTPWVWGIKVWLKATGPSISASNVNIAKGATDAGEISFTINNPVEGGSVTNAESEATWLTFGDIDNANGKVPFTAEANTATSSRSAVVTLTYTYDTDKTATKEVTITQAPDVDGTAIVRATITSATTATVTGSIGGTSEVKLKLDTEQYKFAGKGNYVGITLADGIFQEGDVINIHTTKAAEQGTIMIYDSKEGTNIYQETGAMGVLGDNKFVLNSTVGGKSTIYVCRTETNNWNGFVDFIEVTRPNATITLNASGFATYSSATDFEFAGADAYGMKLSATSLVGTKVTSGKIKAGEGILFKGEAGAKVAITETTGAEAIGENNNLIGTTDADNEIISSSYTYKYALSGDTFKTFTGSLAANKAFFGSDTAISNSLELVFNEAGEATAVDAIAEADEAKTAPVKVIKNGKLYIGNFNVAGQQVK